MPTSKVNIVLKIKTALLYCSVLSVYKDALMFTLVFELQKPMQSWSSQLVSV